MQSLTNCILIVFLAFGIQLNGQEDVVGAYEMEMDGNKAVMIVAPDFYSIAIFNASDHSFVGTEGGAWKDLEKGMVEVLREYNTLDTSSVGAPEKVSVSFDASGVEIEGQRWSRIDNGSPGELAGAWLITGRKREGEIRRRQPGLRKTMKILSGTRFQWIAYHTGTKVFSGTGGGTYTTEDGKYVETIDFFSRDNSRVGAELPFEFEIKEGEWHHSGLSSKGAPIYEIWTKRPLE